MLTVDTGEVENTPDISEFNDDGDISPLSELNSSSSSGKGSFFIQ